jgi:hypothetical protein
MGGVAEVAAHHLDGLRVAFGGPDRRGVTDHPDQGAGDPDVAQHLNRF